MNAGLMILVARSMRHRATAFTATFLAVFLGSAMVGSFATLAETATGPMSNVDSVTLSIMGAVVGGWGLLIVLFSVVTTVGITVTQRTVELGLVRTVGGTPRQVRRLVRAESLAVSVVGAGLGAAVAYATGGALFALIRSGGLVENNVEYGGGALSVGPAASAVVVASVVASSIAARRATRGPARLVLTEAVGELSRIRWWRIAVSLLLIAFGVGGALVTVFVTSKSDDPYAAMQTSGSASLLVAVGLAALAPVWLRCAARLVPLGGGTGPAAYLAVGNARHRAHVLASVLAPVIVLTAAAIGVILLVGIDGRTLTRADVAEAETITLLNYVVVGMITLFAAIMLVNGTAAMLAHRRAELVRLRMVGATPAQVRSLVLIEAAIVTTVGVILGVIASMATVMPFTYARGEGLVPDGQLWWPPAVAAATAALTLGAARIGVRRLPPAPVG